MSQNMMILVGAMVLLTGMAAIASARGWGYSQPEYRQPESIREYSVSGGGRSGGGFFIFAGGRGGVSGGGFSFGK